jgi:hypothetical protein
MHRRSLKVKITTLVAMALAPVDSVNDIFIQIVYFGAILSFYFVFADYKFILF